MVGTELKTDKLPSVPEVLLKLVAACRKPLVSLDEVVSIVKHDAALSARVIAMGSARSHPEKIDQAGFVPRRRSGCGSNRLARQFDGGKSVFFTFLVRQWPLYRALASLPGMRMHGAQPGPRNRLS